MTHQRAILAGGCFWGMEDLFRKLNGVLDTTVGYTGGAFPNPRYEDIKNKDTGHAEALEIIFDDAVLYPSHLKKWDLLLRDGRI